MTSAARGPPPGPVPAFTEGARTWDRSAAARWPAGQCWSPALVTGGTGGIGRATAPGLAAMGAYLAITGRDRGRTQDAAREIRAAGGGQVDAFVADLSSQSQLRRLAGEVLQSLSRIDVLVNNAGVLEHPPCHR